MSYIPNRVSVPTGLDEVGIALGLVRIEGESLSDYQRRLTLETREPSGPTEIQFIASISRRVGEFDIPCFSIDLVRDGDNEPLAPDPYVEVTSSHLRAYSDWDNRIIDTEVDFTDRTSGYFVGDIISALSSSTRFVATVIDDDYQYRLSRSLRYSNTFIHVPSEILKPSIENRLQSDLIKSVFLQSRQVFITEKASPDLIVVSGDYYVDYTNGVIYSFDTQSSFVSYTYRDFPFVVYSQAVRAYPYLDPDKKYFLYDTLISDDTGEPEHTNLNGDGAEIANTVIAAHPLTWGR